MSRPNLLLAIDPGNHPGFAVFRAGLLTWCGIDAPHGLYGGAPDLLVVERPVIYPDSPVPPEDVVALAITAGMLAERYARGCEIIWRPARTWKGQVPKSVTRARVIKRSTPTELEIISAAQKTIAKTYQPDMFDAIGLGHFERGAQGWWEFSPEA
jgi:hypothetical protein